MKKKRKIMMLLMVLIVSLISGCGQEKMEGEKQLKFAYICKDLDHYWFQQVSLGIEQKCMEKGIFYQAFDSDYDNSLCIEQVKQVVEEDYDGSDILPEDFGGCVFNWMDQYEVAKYLAYRYGKAFREEETVRYVLC